MNFVKLYIGDYQRDTGHLSIAEHGAYLLMLQHFYATERPLPKGRALYRLLRAESKVERDAIDAVATAFWTDAEDGSGLINRRALEEIRKAEHQRTINREVGKRGGRPRRTDPETDSVSDQETEHKSDSVPIRNPNQTPDTRHQTLKHLPASILPSSKLCSPAGALSRALREKGVMSNPMDPRLIALAEAGTTPEQAAAAADAARDAKGQHARIPPAYVFAILERWRADPASVPPAAHDPNAAAAVALRLLEQRDAQARSA